MKGEGRGVERLLGGVGGGDGGGSKQNMLPAY